jgi:hypothetical protein
MPELHHWPQIGIHEFRKHLFWKARGLNSGLHWAVIYELILAKFPLLVCLQETKLDVISDFDVMKIIGSGFDYSYLPAIHTRGEGAYWLLGDLPPCHCPSFDPHLFSLSLS